jgi:carbamate kinase
MLVVAALGGNALLRRGEPLTADAQRRNAHVAARALAPIAAAHDLVVTHGNGPQVGLLAEHEDPRAWPLDVLGAETEGMIGYVLEQELRGALPDRDVATLLTQTVVGGDDPAFARPTKPIGPVHPAARAQELRERGWALVAEGGGVRRVVASPEPRDILGLRTVRRLVRAHTVVICAGGGGIPVLRREDRLVGVEAVVDKDLTTALLARRLRADALLLLTDVPGILDDPAGSEPQVLREASPAELWALPLAAGSIGPKADAAARFAAHGGRAAIGALQDAEALLDGTAGTQVRRPRRRSRLLAAAPASGTRRAAPASG